MSNKYKIQLIFPEGGSKLSSSGILPPVGLVSLATYLKSKGSNLPGLEVRLFDGEITPQSEIIERLDANLIGISVTGANYSNALEIAAEAKRKGAKVILGGPHATVKHKQILANRDCIDAVVRGDGEIAFYEYVIAVSEDDDKRLSQVRNLSYRTADGSIVINPLSRKCERTNLNSLPTPDYSLLRVLNNPFSQDINSNSFFFSNNEVILK